VHGHFVANAQAQELFLFMAGLVLGDDRAPAWCGATETAGLSQAPRLRLSEPRRVGEDILLHGLFGD
jgi:riboflavin biosynthesis pyrimidine reductase